MPKFIQLTTCSELGTPFSVNIFNIDDIMRVKRGERCADKVSDVYIRHHAGFPIQWHVLASFEEISAILQPAEVTTGE